MEILPAMGRSGATGQATSESTTLSEHDPSKLSLSDVMNRYDVTNITPKQVDQLVEDLRENGLASFEQLMMLATRGYEFQSHLPGSGQGNKAFNLIAQSEYQLELSRRHGSPTEFAERQLEFIKSLQGDRTSRLSQATSASGGVDGDAWLQKMMQSVLDGRIGLDRSKLQEIEAKIEKIKNDPNLPASQKAQLIDGLEQQKLELIRKTAEQMIEKEKQLQQLRVQESVKNQEIVDALNQARLFETAQGNIKNALEPFNQKNKELISD